MTTRQDIVDTARLALDVRWRHQGRVVPHGVDCAGLVIWTGRQCEVLPASYEPPPYQRTAQWGLFLRHFQENLIEIRLADLGIGDVICFRQNIFPCHCGIMTQMEDDPKFIHSYLPRKRVVEERFTPEWRSLVRGVFRYPGLEN